jgi:arginine repressor
MLAAINSGQDDAPEYVTVREIVERLNEGLEKEAYTPAYVGRRLSALGFRRKRIHGGHVAYIVDMDLLQRLASRYNVTMDMVLPRG